MKLKLASILIAQSVALPSQLSTASELSADEVRTGNDLYDSAVNSWMKRETVKVIGGQEARKDQFPWQVSLGVSWIADSFGAQYCSGTIYNSEWIITSAHCVDKLSPYEIQITLGTHDLNDESIKRNAKAFRVHSDYISPEGGADIALIQLFDPLTFTASVKAITLVGLDADLNNASFTITGWGKTSNDDGSKSATLRYVEQVPFVRNVKCNSPLSYDSLVKPDMICAGFSDGGRDTCQADSGGPLLYFDSDTPSLAGVTSWGSRECGLPRKYGVYASIKHYREWIEQCVQGNECPSK